MESTDPLNRPTAAPHPPPPAVVMADAASSSTSKCGKLAADRSHTSPSSLFPGLPDHIAHLCLSRVQPTSLYSVCRSWRRLVYSPTFPPFLSLYALLCPSNDPFSSSECNPGLSGIEFAAFDPVASRWLPLPPPLSNDQPLRILLRHPSFLSRNFPIQSVSVSGNLVLLAATAKNFYPAIPYPLVFDPISRSWSTGPPLASPRRWCATGVSGSSIYVVSGVGFQFSTEVARSVERWDLYRRFTNHGWQKLRELKDMRFSRDAIEAVGWRGKLCMVNVKGGTFREGIIYDVAEDTWAEMPKGMISGWSGPAAAMDENELYAVDEATGTLRRYSPHRDAWDDVIASADIKGAPQIAAAGGRVCIVQGGSGSHIVVVDVVANPPRTWLVETPERSRVMAVHILPRMNQSEQPCF